MEIKDKTGCAGSLGKARPTLHRRLVNLPGLTKAASFGYLGIRNSSPVSPTPLFGSEGGEPLGSPHFWPARYATLLPSLQPVNSHKWISSWSGRWSGQREPRPKNPISRKIANSSHLSCEPDKYYQGAAFSLLQAARGGWGGEDLEGWGAG